MNKILIIEDEAAIAYALKARLTVDGFNVITAFSAEEGLTVIKKSPIDYIILDILLPKMNGFEFLKKIKNNRKFRNVTVIIISNLNKKEDVDKGLELGAKDYLIKSEFNLDDIIKKIEDKLNDKK